MNKIKLLEFRSNAQDYKEILYVYGVCCIIFSIFAWLGVVLVFSQEIVEVPLFIDLSLVCFVLALLGVIGVAIGSWRLGR